MYKNTTKYYLCVIKFVREKESVFHQNFSGTTSSVCLLSHLVPEILGPEVGLIFHKMYYLTDFKHFVSIFSLIGNPIDPLFH